MKYLIAALCVMLSLNTVANTDAATETEKRYLIKIAQELAHLDELANKASSTADPDARVTLDYVALRHDLQEIKRALETHINKPLRTPRNITALELVSN